MRRIHAAFPFTCCFPFLSANSFYEENMCTAFCFTCVTGFYDKRNSYCFLFRTGLGQHSFVTRETFTGEILGIFAKYAWTVSDNIIYVIFAKIVKSANTLGTYLMRIIYIVMTGEKSKSRHYPAKPIWL